MVKLPAFVCVLIAATVGLGAQTGLLQEGTLKDWTSQRDMLLKIAAAMPEEKFGTVLPRRSARGASRFCTSPRPT